jgi:hypothetical protein
MSLTSYLRKYYEIQDKILVCYHPTHKSSWADRCLFLSEEYESLKPYNHRSILNNEVVIEFDDGTKEENEELAREVARRLKRDGFKIAMWCSGNKSTHVHTFVDTKEAHNVQLLKKVFTRHYCKGLNINPDLRLCTTNHLIRAENGVHEKTGKQKSLIYKHREYPVILPIPIHIWEEYAREQTIVIKRRVTHDINELDKSPLFKSLLNSVKFREDIGDGRERLIFAFIHILKSKYTNKEDLVAYLWDWYKYSGGNKMNEYDIRNKVRYHWNKDYTITENYLRRIMEECSIEVETLLNDS